MAVKTWASGEVLTASDLNTYAGNPGLVYVSTTTIGSAVSQVNVNNCFSSTYDNYRVVISNTVMSSGGGGLRFVLGGTVPGANYYAGSLYLNTSTSAVTGAGQNNTGFITIGSTTSAYSFSNSFDVLNPYNAVRTYLPNFLAFGELTFTGFGTGIHNADTSYTGFTIYPGSGTMTGGVVVVYGYRKA